MFADYSRYTRSVRGSAIAVFLGLAVTSAWMMPLGAIAARAAGTSDPGAMLSAVGLGAAGALLLTLATLTTNFVNIYMSSLAWKSLAPRRQRQRGDLVDRHHRHRAQRGAGRLARAIHQLHDRARRRCWCRSAACWSRTTTFAGRALDEAFIAELYDPAGSFRGVSIAGDGGVGRRRRGVLRGRVDRRHAAGAGGLGPRLPRAAIHSAAMRRIASLVAIALLACGALPRAQTRTPRVVMLGTGTPNADPDRDGPSVAVVVDETSYLVDFGVGVVRRAAAAERLGHQGAGRAEPDARVRDAPALRSHAGPGRSDPDAMDSRAADAADALRSARAARDDAPSGRGLCRRHPHPHAAAASRSTATIRGSSTCTRSRRASSIATSASR